MKINLEKLRSSKSSMKHIFDALEEARRIITEDFKGFNCFCHNTGHEKGCRLGGKVWQAAKRFNERFER